MDPADEGTAGSVTARSQRKQNMEKMYEVLKFIEHGTHCRQSMDCVQGMILLDFMKENPAVEKAVLLKWFRQLAVCVDQFHRCRGRQNYRYLNPCSVLVSESGKILLLDMEAADNAPAMKQMQSRAMRSHFVKPLYEMGTGRSFDADIYAYGKTIQFMLAYLEVEPALTKREELRLSRVIRRCTGESKKRYEEFRQIVNELPVPAGRKTNSRGKGERALTAAMGGAAAGIILCAILVIAGENGSSAAGPEGRLAAGYGEDMAAENGLTEKVLTEKSAGN